jgi:hypothetical protein
VQITQGVGVKTRSDVPELYFDILVLFRYEESANEFTQNSYKASGDIE